MSLAEQSDGGAAPAQQESSVEIQPSPESQQASSPISEGAEKGVSSGGMGLALAPIRVQPLSPTMRMSLIWGLRLDLMSLRRLLLTCLLGRICLLFRGLMLTRRRALRGYGQLLLRRRTKLRRNLNHLAWLYKALRIKILPNH